MSFDKDMVRVYNYNSFGVSMKTNDRSVLLSGTLDPNYPTMETFAFKELEYVNTHSPVIRNGMVEFDEGERDEIYKALHLNKWADSCIFEREIDQMLTTATFETMKRVVEVKDMPTIDRIYAHMMRLMRENAVDVSSRVQKVVTVRRNELREGVMTSKIQLVPKKPDEPKFEFTQEELSQMIKEQIQAAVKMTEMAEAADRSVKLENADEPIIDLGETAEAPIEEPKKPPVKRTTRSTKAKTK